MNGLLSDNLLAVGSFDQVLSFLLLLTLISVAMLLMQEQMPYETAPDRPTRLKPGWIRITGNFSRARKKKIPEPKAIRSNLEDWLDYAVITDQLRIASSGIEGGCRRSFSFVWKPEHSEIRYLQPFFIAPNTLIESKVLLSHPSIIIIRCKKIIYLTSI